MSGLCRFQPLGVEESIPQKIAFSGVKKIVKRYRVDLLNRIGPVRVDQYLIHVGHDQKRWMVKRHRIPKQLIECSVKVLALALVFPCEAVLAPDVGPAFATGSLRSALLKREPLALGVSRGRLFNIQKAAKIVEMRLRGRAFL